MARTLACGTSGTRCGPSRRGAWGGGGTLRWVLLERSDALSADTQAFLRRMLETTAGCTRFAFEVREAGSISEPLLSRVQMVALSKPTEGEVRGEVTRRTQGALSEEAVAEIAFEARGSVRAAVCRGVAARWVPVAAPMLGPGGACMARLLPPPPDAQALCALVEPALRSAGADPREYLRRAYPGHRAAAQCAAAWDRLGGASPRALFLHAALTGGMLPPTPPAGPPPGAHPGPVCV